MVDRDTCSGGSWNARTYNGSCRAIPLAALQSRPGRESVSNNFLGRLYPSFWSQTGVDMAEFSDLPMAISPGEPIQYCMMHAKCVTRYLENYMAVHTYSNSTLRDRFRSRVDVRSMERQDDGLWRVQAVLADGSETTYHATKVVMATGLTSIPNIPELPNQTAFDGPIMHQEGFGSSEVISSNAIETVAVIGGGKSAVDMVYACGKAGKKVHWLIREDGSGPPSFIGIEGKNNYRNGPEMASSRIISSASPSPFTPDNTRTRFMGRTVLGRTLMGSVWSTADKQRDVYLDDETMDREDLQLLRPKARYYIQNITEKCSGLIVRSTFWNKSPPALVQHADFFSVLAETTTVHRASITSMSGHTIGLSDGQTVPCDAVLLGTGWKDSHYAPFNEEQRLELGLPHSAETESPGSSAMWSWQHEDADSRLRKKWPSVTNPPPYKRAVVTTTPYRLYKLIAPLNDPDRSIVFLGLASVANHFRTAEAQAIWATGYLDRRLHMPSLENRRREIAQVNVWCRRRYLNRGMLGNCLWYDWVGYCDAMLDEAGVLSAMRGSRSAWNWWTRPNLARDLFVAKQAYLERHEGRRRRRINAKGSWEDVGDTAEVDTIATKRSFSIISWRS